MLINCQCLTFIVLHLYYFLKASHYIFKLLTEYRINQGLNHHITTELILFLLVSALFLGVMGRQYDGFLLLISPHGRSSRSYRSRTHSADTGIDHERQVTDNYWQRSVISILSSASGSGYSPLTMISLPPGWHHTWDLLTNPFNPWLTGAFPSLTDNIMLRELQRLK